MCKQISLKKTSLLESIITWQSVSLMLRPCSVEIVLIHDFVSNKEATGSMNGKDTMGEEYNSR